MFLVGKFISDKVTHNDDQVLLQLGYFIMSCPEQLLIENMTRLEVKN